MTLEDAIKHCEEVAKSCQLKAYDIERDDYKDLEECATEHRQLAEWLRELKERREKDAPDTNVGDMVSRAAAIEALMDEFKRAPTTAIRAKNRIDRLPSAQPNLQQTCNKLATVAKDTNVPCKDTISRTAAIDAIDDANDSLVKDDYTHGVQSGMEKAKYVIEALPSAQPEWNNHTVACLLAELFDDTCACNYNGIDEWLPEKCEVIDSCPNPVGVACWEQYLKHRAERRTDG